MIIDTHAHLDSKDFDADREEVVQRTVAAGVSLIINPGTDLKSSQKAIELSQKYPQVYAAVGIQPEGVNQYFTEEPDEKLFNPRKIKIDVRTELEKLTQNKKVVAIGECGLDYYHLRRLRKDSPYQGESFFSLEKEKQKDIFRRQLGLAVLLDLPVIIHNRGADEDILAEIQRYKETKKLRGVFHCFTGTEPFARKVLEAGFLISFTGIITYPNAQGLRNVVKEIPLEKIMVESDAPFLAPQKYRGQRNEPAYVNAVAKTLAEIRAITFEEVVRATCQTTQKLFRLA